MNRRRVITAMQRLLEAIEGKACGVGQRADLTGCIPKGGAAGRLRGEAVHAAYDELVDAISTVKDSMGYERRVVEASKLTPEATAVMDAATLFTTEGGVDLIRDPSAAEHRTVGSFDGPSIIYRNEDGSRKYIDRHKVEQSREAFESARRVMTALATRKIPPGQSPEVSRGVALPTAVAQQLKEGDVTDLGGMLSFSQEGWTASRFANQRRDEINKREGEGAATSVIFTIPKGKAIRGSDISEIGTGDLEEFVSSGKVQLTDVETRYDGTMVVTCEQV